MAQRTRKGLTADRKKTLVTLAAWNLTKRFSPSIRELFGGLGCSSSNALTTHLHFLRDEGLIEWEPGAARTIRLTKKAWVVLVGLPHAKKMDSFEQQTLQLLKRALDDDDEYDRGGK